MNRKRITAILILFMLIFSMEATMATKGNNQLAGRPDNNKPSNIPLAPANQKVVKPLRNAEPDYTNGKGYDQFAGAPQDNQKNYDQLAPAPQSNPWQNTLDTLVNTVAGAATGGAIQNPVLSAAAAGALLPVMSHAKPMDAMQQQQQKAYDSLVNRMLAARSDLTRGYQGRSDQLAPHNTGFGTDYGGFGSTYNGWGGGGGGGYGGGYGGYDNAYNPWINYMMGLNNWQI